MCKFRRAGREEHATPPQVPPSFDPFDWLRAGRLRMYFGREIEF